MKGCNMLEFYQNGNLVVPIYLLKCYKDWNITLEEFIFIMYLQNKKGNIVFNPSIFQDELNLSKEAVMSIVSSLTDKHMIHIEVFKNEDNLMEERIDLTDFYQKLMLKLMEEKKSEDVSNSNVFELIEKEFGRTLGAMEYEIIKSWLEHNTSEELIIEALREASFSGVSNLRYMDKILYEWSKKGIKTKEDVEKNKKHFIEKQDNIGEVFEYDWFEDNEE